MKTGCTEAVTSSLRQGEQMSTSSDGRFAMIYYPPAEHKSLSKSEPRPLPELAEARGKLLSVVLRDGLVVATFPWGVITLPETLEMQLRSFVGRKCAILRLDGIYHVRAV